MYKQISLSAITDELGQTVTHKKEFLQQIDRIILWSEWKGIIEPHYYMEYISTVKHITSITCESRHPPLPMHWEKFKEQTLWKRGQL